MEKANIDSTLIIPLLKKSPKNKGQHNCGILYIDRYVVKIISKLCPFTEESHLNYNKYALSINENLAGYYPKYYTWDDQNANLLLDISENSIPEYVRCVIMERLDGDLTSYILESSYKILKGNLLDYDDFYDRLPKTNGKYVNDTSDEFKSFKKEIYLLFRL
jgi:hypothetical protein